MGPSTGALLRNRQQVSNLRRRTDEAHEPLAGKKKDPLFAVMSMCKDSDGKGTAEHFVRIVTGAPEPMTVLCFDWSLNAGPYTAHLKGRLHFEAVVTA